MPDSRRQIRGVARAACRLQQIALFRSTLWRCTVDGLASTFFANSDRLGQRKPKTDDWVEGFSVTLRHAPEATGDGMCWTTTDSMAARWEAPYVSCFFFKVAFSEQAADGVAARVLLVAFVKITGCVQWR
jgi:hypothetical protein